MLAFSRRGFISASAAVGVLARTEKLFAQGAPFPGEGAAVPKNGAFSVFLSDERVVAMIRSADRPPIPVVFDTGSSGNMIDVGIAKSLRLKRVPDHIVKVVDGATGKSFDASDYMMPDISIGGMSVGDRRINGYPWIEDNAAGIFGPDLFAGQIVLVDLAASRVRVFDKAGFAMPAQAPTPYQGEKGAAVPAVEISLPSKGSNSSYLNAAAKLDTGNNTALKLPSGYMDRLPLMRPPTIVGRTTSSSGTRDVMGGQIKGMVKIGSAGLSNPDVIFDGLTPNVGLPVITRLRMLLDPAKEQSWLLNEVTLPLAVLSNYVGQYGLRRVVLEGSHLIYQRQGRPDLLLVPLGCDIFNMEGSPNQIWFERTAGRVTKMNLVSDGHQMTVVDREG